MEGAQTTDHAGPPLGLLNYHAITMDVNQAQQFEMLLREHKWYKHERTTPYFEEVIEVAATAMRVLHDTTDASLDQEEEDREVSRLLRKTMDSEEFIKSLERINDQQTAPAGGIEDANASADQQQTHCTLAHLMRYIAAGSGLIFTELVLLVTLEGKVVGAIREGENNNGLENVVVMVCSDDTEYGCYIRSTGPQVLQGAGQEGEGDGDGTKKNALSCEDRETSSAQLPPFDDVGHEMTSALHDTTGEAVREGKAKEFWLPEEEVKSMAVEEAMPVISGEAEAENESGEAGQKDLNDNQESMECDDASAAKPGMALPLSEALIQSPELHEKTTNPGAINLDTIIDITKADEGQTACGDEDSDDDDLNRPYKIENPVYTPQGAAASSAGAVLVASLPQAAVVKQSVLRFPPTVPDVDMSNADQETEDESEDAEVTGAVDEGAEGGVAEERGAEETDTGEGPAGDGPGGEAGQGGVAEKCAEVGGAEGRRVEDGAGEDGAVEDGAGEDRDGESGREESEGDETPTAEQDVGHLLGLQAEAMNSKKRKRSDIEPMDVEEFFDCQEDFGTANGNWGNQDIVDAIAHVQAQHSVKKRRIDDDDADTEGEDTHAGVPYACLVIPAILVAYLMSVEYRVLMG